MSDTDPAIRLLVLDRGHVLVGRSVPPDTVGLWLAVTDVRVVRRWGTTEGLGQLAAGPTADTVLDARMDRVTVPVRAILFTLDSLSEELWSPHLSSPHLSSGAATPARRSARRS